MGLPIPLHVEGDPPMYATFVCTTHNTYFRWKDSLHLLTIGIQQAKLTRKCMEIPVPSLYSMTFNKRELTYDMTGPVNISLPAQVIGTDNRVLQATQQLSSEFPFNIDYNSGDTIGIGKALDLFPLKIC